MLIGLVIGLVMLKFFKVNMRDNPATKDTYGMISVFLLPILILSDIVSVYEKNLLQRFKPNFFFGFLSSLLSIVSTMIGFNLANKYKILGTKKEYTWQVMLTMSCFLNLSSDSGYRLIKTLGTTELYKVVREKFIINLVMIVGIVYTLRDENVIPQTDIPEVFLRYTGMSLFSSTLGIFLGVAFTLIQNRSTSLRKNPVAEIQFILCFVFMTHFAVQMETDYICDEIPIIFLGLVIAGFSKFNMSPEAVRRLSFLLETLAKLAKLLTMAMMGLVMPDALLNWITVKKIMGMYMFFVPLTLLNALFHCLICKVFRASDGQFGIKEFLMLYCTSMSKGPLAFLLARKYFNFSTQLVDEVDLFIFTSMILFDPMSYIVSQYFPCKPKVSFDEKAKMMTEQLMGQPETSVWGKTLAYLIDRVFSPLLINNYRRRNEEGEFELICRTEELVLSKSDFCKRTIKNIIQRLKVKGLLTG